MLFRNAPCLESQPLSPYILWVEPVYFCGSLIVRSQDLGDVSLRYIDRFDFGFNFVDRH